MKENNFCSCCLSEECYKDMANVYYFGKRKENYFEMLANIFNVNIPNKDAIRCLICEECVSKLRAAASFKKQVLNAQETILKKLSQRLKTNDQDENNTRVLKTEEEEEFDDFEDNLSDSFNERDFVWENTPQYPEKEKLFIIKLQPKNDKNTLQSTDKQEVTQLLSFNEDNQLLNNTETQQNGDDFDVSSNDGIQDGVEENAGKRPIKKIVKKKKAVKVPKSSTSKPKRKPEILPETLVPTRENTIKLIQNSNLCLFRSLQNKFGCYLCKTTFLDLPTLREHTNTHTKTNFTRRVNQLRGLSYKNADISDLKCSICDSSCLNLTELMSHLEEKHKICMSGSEHFLIPYKIQDGFRCVLCDLEFNTYLRLSIHMHSHYTHNVCEKCGQSFISRLCLRAHLQSMHKEKKCSLCPLTFLTSSEKVKHLRKVHNIFNSKRHCTICNQTFRYTYLLENHKVEQHGAEKLIKTCPECGKTFLNPTNLNLHLRSVHKKERNHACAVCGMRFFRPGDRKRHEKTHEDVRSFSCSYCESKFKSTDSWRRHLKTQHGVFNRAIKDS